MDDAPTILIKFTYGGDAVLIGVLIGVDYFLLDSNVLPSGMVFGYRAGDVDLNGAFSGDDYFVFDCNVLASEAEIL